MTPGAGELADLTGRAGLDPLADLHLEDLAAGAGLDLSALLGADTAGLAYLASGQAISASALLHLACDAQIVPVIFSDTGGILAYGRERRLASVGQRLALAARDGGCSFPGCDRPPAWTEVHHVIEWITAGTTDLDNMTLLALRPPPPQLRESRLAHPHPRRRPLVDAPTVRRPDPDPDPEHHPPPTRDRLPTTRPRLTGGTRWMVSRGRRPGRFGCAWLGTGVESWIGMRRLRTRRLGTRLLRRRSRRVGSARAEDGWLGTAVRQP
jgi:hypothetical protein